MREREEGEVQEARQRASIKWLVAKAYNNSPPREFVDPFYKDYKDVERLKPHLVHALGRYTWQEPEYLAGAGAVTFSRL